MRLILCLLLLCLAGTLIQAKISHSCIHEKISGQYPILEEGPESEEEKHNRLLQNDIIRPFKIHIDTSRLIDLPQELKDYLADKIVPVAFKFLSQRIQVASNGQNLKLTSKKCRNVSILFLLYCGKYFQP
jgi:hypothetical protein